MVNDSGELADESQGEELEPASKIVPNAAEVSTLRHQMAHTRKNPLGEACQQAAPQGKTETFGQTVKPLFNSVVSKGPIGAISGAPKGPTGSANTLYGAGSTGNPKDRPGRGHDTTDLP